LYNSLRLHKSCGSLQTLRWRWR